jgi:hypothetical protein
MEALDRCTSDRVRALEDEDKLMHLRPICQICDAIFDISLNEQQVTKIQEDPLLGVIADQIKDTIIPVFETRDNAVYLGSALKVLALINPEKYADQVAYGMLYVDDYATQDLIDILDGKPQNVFVDRGGYLNSVENDELYNSFETVPISEQEQEEYDTQMDDYYKKKHEIAAGWWDTDNKEHPTLQELEAALQDKKYYGAALYEIARYDKDSPDYKEVLELVGKRIYSLRTLAFEGEHIDVTYLDSCAQVLADEIKYNPKAYADTADAIDYILTSEHGDKYLKRRIKENLLSDYNEAIEKPDLYYMHSLAVVMASTFDHTYSELEDLKVGIPDLQINLQWLVASANLNHVSVEKAQKLNSWLTTNRNRALSYLVPSSEMASGTLGFVFQYLQRENIYSEQEYIDFLDTQVTKPSFSQIRRMIESGIDVFSYFGERQTINYLIEFGFTPEDATRVVGYWQKGASARYVDDNEEERSYYSFPRLIETHLKKIQKLEEAREQSAATLFTEFGIANFGRYSTEMLITQYDQREEKVPYVLISNPVVDWNGSFNTEPLMDTLFKSLGDYNRAYSDRNIVRIIEGNENAEQFQNKIKSMNARYGADYKPSNNVIGGHSDGKYIYLSYEEHGYLDTSDLMDESIRDMFGEVPVFIFKACSTGAPEMYAQTLSRALGCYTYGPNKPASLVSLSAKRIDGKLRIVPVYTDRDGKEVTVLYFNGEEQ